MFQKKRMSDCAMLQKQEDLSAMRGSWLKWKISLKEGSCSDRKEGQEGNHAEKWDVSPFTRLCYSFMLFMLIYTLKDVNQGGLLPRRGDRPCDRMVQHKSRMRVCFPIIGEAKCLITM
jgi:hypothetical protein